MAFIRLPDGQELEVPDRLTQEESNQLKQAIQEKYADYDDNSLMSSLPLRNPYLAPEITGRERIREIIKGVPRGATNTVLSSGQGIVGLFDKDNDSNLYRALGNMKKNLNERSALAVDPDYQARASVSDNWMDEFAPKFGEGLGSVATFAGPRLASGALGAIKGVSGQSQRLMNTMANTTAGATAFGMGVNQQQEQMAKVGMEDIGMGKEIGSELFGGAIGLTELLPIFRLMRRMPKTDGSQRIVDAGFQRLKNAAITGGEEAIQESLAGFAQALYGSAVYDPSLSPTESLWDDFTVGGAVGFASDLLLNALTPGTFRDRMNQVGYQEEENELIEDARHHNTSIANRQPRDITLIVQEDQTNEGVPVFHIIEQETGRLHASYDNEEMAQTQARLFNTRNAKDKKIANINEHSFEIGQYSDPLTTTAILQTIDGNILGKNRYNFSMEELFAFDPKYAKYTSKDRNRIRLDQKFFKTKIFKDLLKRYPSLSFMTNNRTNNPFYGSLTSNDITQLIDEGILSQDNPVIQRALHSRARAALHASMGSPEDKVYENIEHSNTPESEAQLKKNLEIRRQSDRFEGTYEDFTENITKAHNSNTFNLINDQLEILGLAEKLTKKEQGSKNFKKYAKLITGKENYTDMTLAEKMLLHARLQQLPRNVYSSARDIQLARQNKTRLMPDVTERTYALGHLNNLLTRQDNDNNNSSDIKSYTKKQLKQMTEFDGQILEGSNFEQLLERLIDSGRVTKTNNKYTFFEDFRKILAGNSKRFYESNQEFKNRLSNLRSFYNNNEFLLDKNTIDAIIKQDNKNELNLKSNADVTILDILTNPYMTNPVEKAYVYAGLNQLEEVSPLARRRKDDRPQLVYDPTDPKTLDVGFVDFDVPVKIEYDPTIGNEISVSREEGQGQAEFGFKSFDSVKDFLEAYELKGARGAKEKDVIIATQFRKNLADMMKRNGLGNESANFVAGFTKDTEFFAYTKGKEKPQKDKKLKQLYENRIPLGYMDTRFEEESPSGAQGWVAQNVAGAIPRMFVVLKDEETQQFIKRLKGDYDHLESVKPLTTRKEIVDEVNEYFDENTPSITSTINHESIHLIRRLGLFKSNEWQSLVKYTQEFQKYNKKNVLGISTQHGVKPLESIDLLTWMVRWYGRENYLDKFATNKAEQLSQYNVDFDNFVAPSSKNKNPNAYMKDLQKSFAHYLEDNGVPASVIYETIDGKDVMKDHIKHLIDLYSEEAVAELYAHYASPRYDSPIVHNGEVKFYDEDNIPEGENVYTKQFADKLDNASQNSSKKITGKPKNLLDRISNFIKSMLGAEILTQEKDNVSEEELENALNPVTILESIESGEIGSRQKEKTFLKKQILDYRNDMRGANIDYFQVRADEYFTENGLPISEMGKVLDEVFKNFTPRQIDNMSMDEMNQLLDRVSKITNEKKLRLKASDKQGNQSYRTFKELKQLIAKTLRKGYDKDWYLDIGREAEALVGQDNMAEFSSIWAITSASADPETNFRDTLNIMMAVRGIEIVGDKKGQLVYRDYRQDPKGVLERLQEYNLRGVSSDQLNSIQKLYDDTVAFPKGVWGTKGTGAQKTAAYALNTLMVKDGELVPFAVLDRWMYRAFGFPEAIGNKPSKPKKEKDESKTAFNKRLKAWEKQLKQKDSEGHPLGDIRTEPKASEIHYVQYMIKQLSDTVFKVDGQDINLRPDQVQALLWFGVRDANKTDGTVESILNASNKEIELINKAKTNNAFNDNDAFIDVSEMGLSPSQRIRYEGTYGYGFSLIPSITEYAKETASKIEVDLLPSNSFGYLNLLDREGNPIELNNKQRKTLSANIFNAITEGSVNNKKLTFMKDLGIPHAVRMEDGKLYLDVFGRKNNVKENQNFRIVIEDALMQITDPNTQSASQNLEFYGSSSQLGSLEQSLLSNLYLPSYSAYRNFLSRRGYRTQEDLLAPYEKENTALTKSLTANESKMLIVRKALSDINDNAPAGSVPPVNLDTTSNLAKEIAYDQLKKNFEEPSPKDDQLPEINPKDYPIEIRKARAEENQYYPPGEKAGFKIDRDQVDELPFMVKLINTLSETFYNNNSFRRAFLDKFEAIERLSEKAFGKKLTGTVKEKAQLLASQSAIGAARLGGRIKGTYEEALKNGGIVVYTGSDLHEGGTKVIYQDGYKIMDPNHPDDWSKAIDALDADGNKKEFNLLKAFAGLQIEVDGKIQSLENMFQEYGIYRRVKAIVDQHPHGNMFTRAMKKKDPKVYKAILQSRGNKYERWAKEYPQIKEAWDQYQWFNKSVLEYASVTGIVDKDLAEDWSNLAYYFPFYSQLNDSKSGVSDWFNENVDPGPANLSPSAFDRQLNIDKALGTQAPALDAITQNSLSILQLGAKNIVRHRIVQEQQALGLGMYVSDKEIKMYDVDDMLHTFMIKVNGERRYFRADDPAIVEALTNYGEPTLGKILEWIGMPANWLRELITRDPGFMFVNLMRDTLSAYVTSGSDYIPFADTFKNFIKPIEDIQQFGLVGGYDFSNDAKDISKWRKKEMKKLNREEDGSIDGMSMIQKVWDGLGNYTTASDAATRQAVYKDVLEKTGDEFEAAYQALEIINFNRRGASPLVRVFTTAIPFLNARMQGLDVLYRSGRSSYSQSVRNQRYARHYGANQANITEQEGTSFAERLDGRNFFVRIALLSALSSFYWLMVSDEDEYKNLRREVRDDNYVIPLTKNTAIKIPIAFEVGVLTKVVPERLLEALYGDDTFKDTRESYWRAIRTTFNFDLTPQLVKPYLEATTNYNKFTRRPIVPTYMESLEPGMQSEFYTNELSRVIGETFNVSPMKIDHLIRGYTGTLGTYAMMLTDSVTRELTGTPQGTRRRWMSDTPLRRIFMDTDTSRGLQQSFYNLRNDVNQIVTTLNKLKKEGRMDEAYIYQMNNFDLLSVRNDIKAIDKFMKRWRERRNEIQMNKGISYNTRKQLLLDLEYERDRRLLSIPLLQQVARGQEIEGF